MLAPEKLSRVGNGEQVFMVFTEPEFEALDASEMREVILAESAANERKAEALRQATEIAENMPMDELRQVVDAQFAEAADREQLERDKESVKFNAAEYETRNMDQLQIEELMATRQAEARVAAAKAPEKEQEKKIRNLSQEIDDLEYVKGEKSKPIAAMIASEVAAQRAAEARTQAIEIAFVNSHPEYARTPENGKALVDFLIASNAPESLAGLENAYRILAAKGALHLYSPEQIEGQRRLQEAVESGKVTVRPTRRASSVPSSGAPSLYDHKQDEPSQEDLENMSAEKFLEYGRKHNWIDPQMSERGGVRSTARQIF